MAAANESTSSPQGFPWAVLIGVVGTLLGAFLGFIRGFFDNRHADKSRLRGERLQAYSDMLGSATRLLTMMAVAGPDAIAERFEHTTIEIWGGFVAAASRAQLLADESHREELDRIARQLPVRLTRSLQDDVDLHKQMGRPRTVDDFESTPVIRELRDLLREMAAVA